MESLAGEIADLFVDGVYTGYSLAAFAMGYGTSFLITFFKKLSEKI
ncbi:hypothetical protein GCM10022394_35500 [Zobellella aerophila]|uniref:Uncharacterized protein n=1 Tax=Zobellella aerophila TaxID=870480 RepID=A0ABP6WMB9_9GAMM